jgi:hypothetical protein
MAWVQVPLLSTFFHLHRMYFTSLQRCQPLFEVKRLGKGNKKVYFHGNYPFLPRFYHVFLKEKGCRRRSAWNMDIHQVEAYSRPAFEIGMNWKGIPCDSTPIGTWVVPWNKVSNFLRNNWVTNIQVVRGRQIYVLQPSNSSLPSCSKIRHVCLCI